MSDMVVDRLRIAVSPLLAEEAAVSSSALQQERLMTGSAAQGDQRAVVPAGPRKYYTLSIDFKVAGPSPMRDWVNQNEQMKGYYPDSANPFCGLQFSEPPRIKFDCKGKRGALPDADTSGLSATWLVSDRLKGLLKRIDPEAFVFQRAEVDYSNFPEPGTGYWFCYFMRELDCVDEEHSVIRYFDNAPGIKAYDALLDVKMRPDVVGSAHAFRLKYDNSRSIVDDVIVAAIKAEKIRGFEFKPIQKG